MLLLLDDDGCVIRVFWNITRALQGALKTLIKSLRYNRVSNNPIQQSFQQKDYRCCNLCGCQADQGLREENRLRMHGNLGHNSSFSALQWKPYYPVFIMIKDLGERQKGRPWFPVWEHMPVISENMFFYCLEVPNAGSLKLHLHSNEKPEIVLGMVSKRGLNHGLPFSLGRQISHQHLPETSPHTTVLQPQHPKVILLT